MPLAPCFDGDGRRICSDDNGMHQFPRTSREARRRQGNPDTERESRLSDAGGATEGCSSPDGGNNCERTGKDGGNNSRQSLCYDWYQFAGFRETNISGPVTTGFDKLRGGTQIVVSESKCLNPWDVQSKHIQPENGIAEALYRPNESDSTVRNNEHNPNVRGR